MKAVIVGGTGTLGHELIRQLYNSCSSIVSVSRCELKQKELKDEFPKVVTVLGDIRDKQSLLKPFKNADVVFHVAALKHIEVMEENPEECIKTNVIGTLNVCDAAEEAGVKRVVFSSTDKAVLPINIYGMAKAVSEKIMLSRGHIVYRWGNVANSRGAATHYFKRAIENNEPVNLTHPDMTRFWIRIEDAVKFMIDTYKTASGIMIPNIRITDLRPGEKLHESILPDVTSKNSAKYSMMELVEIFK
jgi:UDP-N-acetylglucosamine 4,6-dehydratase/5-epimerase